MNRIAFSLIGVLVLSCYLPGQSPARTSPTGWSAIVLPKGSYRDCIKATPIERRPGRLLHVYGNSVRLLDQYTTLRAARPIRQVFLGTPSLMNELQDR